MLASSLFSRKVSVSNTKSDGCSAAIAFGVNLHTFNNVNKGPEQNQDVKPHFMFICTYWSLSFCIDPAGP